MRCEGYEWCSVKGVKVCEGVKCNDAWMVRVNGVKGRKEKIGILIESTFSHFQKRKKTANTITCHIISKINRCYIVTCSSGYQNQLFSFIFFVRIYFRFKNKSHAHCAFWVVEIWNPFARATSEHNKLCWRITMIILLTLKAWKECSYAQYKKNKSATRMMW